jgi:hypothetical protein
MITSEIVLDLMKDKKVLNKESEYQEEIVERYKALKNHFDEDYPLDLLRSNRPGEEEWMLNERIRVWESPTIAAIHRVENLLHKIRQADDFQIYWNIDEVDTGIPKERSLEKYLTYQIPVVKNLEDYTFQVFQNAYLFDPNSRQFNGPDVYELEFTEDFSKPYPQIIKSEQILKVGQDYFFFELTEREDQIRKFIGIDKNSAWFITYDKKDQIDDKVVYTEFVRPNIFKDYPIKAVGSVVSEIVDNTIVYDSILAGAIPSWNQALRRADDDNIIWIKFAYPKEWEISSGSCKKCKGSGKIGTDTCKTCAGEGNIKTETPFNKLVINATKANALNPNVAAIPTPPIGQIERPVEVIKMFGEEIDRQIDKGYRALGLENLNLVPLATSGESKIQDKKEVHTFLYQVAVVYVDSYYWNAKQTYLYQFGSLQNVVISEDQMKKALPNITIPTEYDILSADAIAQSLALAKDKGFGPEIINGLERDLLVKQYGENSESVKRQRIINILDPLPNLTPTDKTLYREAGMVSDLDAIISVKLVSYINRFVSLNDKWWNKTFEEMRNDLIQAAQSDLQSIKSSNLSRVELEA